MAFDIQSAKPAAGKFDLRTSRPVAQEAQPTQPIGALNLEEPGLKERIAQAASGINEGIVGLPGIPGAILNPVLANLGVPEEYRLYSPEDFANLARETGGVLPEPAETDATGKLIRNIGVNVGASALPVSKLATGAKQVATSLIPAVTGGVGQTVGGEVGGPYGEIAGAVLGSLAPAGVSAAVNAANRATQTAATVTPRALNAAIEATEGAPTTVGGRALKPFVAPNPEFVKESDALTRATGVQFTPGQRSGVKGAIGAENAARQGFFTADDMRAADAKISGQLESYINKVMEGVSRSPQKAETAGAAVQTAVRKGIDNLATARDAQAAKDYGGIRSAFGKELPIEYKNLTDEIANIIDEYDLPAEAAQKVAASAKARLGEVATVDEATGQLVPKVQALDKAMKARSYYSKAAAGSGKVFDDLSPSDNQKVARRLLNAIEDDFDAVADAAGGTLGDALRSANANYRTGSLAIEQAQNNAVGALLGKDIVKGGVQIAERAPEDVANALRKLPASRAKTVRGFLDQHSPETVDNVKRYLLEQAFEKAKATPVSAGPYALPEFGKYLRALPEDDVLKVWFTPKEIGRLSNIENSVKRMGDKFGFNFSGTAAQSAFLDMLKNPVGAAVNIAGGKAIAKSALEGAPTYLVRDVRSLVKEPTKSQRAATALSATAPSQNQ